MGESNYRDGTRQLLTVSLTEEYPVDVVAKAATQDGRVAEKGQVDAGREDALVHHGHRVVLEAQDAVVDVQLGQLFLVDAHLVLRLHVHDPLLHLVPCQVVQLALEEGGILVIVCQSKATLCSYVHDLEGGVVEQFDVVELDKVVGSAQGAQD